MFCWVYDYYYLFLRWNYPWMSLEVWRLAMPTCISLHLMRTTPPSVTLNCILLFRVQEQQRACVSQVCSKLVLLLNYWICLIMKIIQWLKCFSQSVWRWNLNIQKNILSFMRVPWDGMRILRYNSFPQPISRFHCMLRLQLVRNFFPLWTQFLYIEIQKYLEHLQLACMHTCIYTYK